MIVIKKTGRQPFDKNKIKNAIIQANNQIGFPNFNLINSIVDDIETEMTEWDEDEIPIEEVENLVMSYLYREMPDVAREYSSYKIKKEKSKENPSEIEKVLFNAPEIKYENGNKNTELTHIKNAYLAEIPSGELMRELLPKDCLEANNRGVVAFHDLNFAARPLPNCLTGDTFVTIQDERKNSRVFTLKELGEFLGAKEDGIYNLSDRNFKILGRDGWTNLNAFSRRKTKENEKVYRIGTYGGYLPLKATGEHIFPIVRDGKEILEKVKNLRKGDKLISVEKQLITLDNLRRSSLALFDYDSEEYNLDIRVTGISALKDYLAYKYRLVFTDYARENFKDIKTFSNQSQAFISARDFKKLISDYPIPYEVMADLRVKACGSKHTYPLFIPYSPALAKLYGYIYSDGSIYVNENRAQYHLNFANMDLSIIKDFIRCWKEVFGEQLSYSYPHNGDTSPCIRVNTGSRLAIAIFKDYCGAAMNGSADLRIPDFILLGTEDVKIAFLSSVIDSDGHFTGKTTAITSVCEGYCRQLLLLSNSLGLHPTMKLKNRKGTAYYFPKSGIRGTRKYDSYQITFQSEKDRRYIKENFSTIKNKEVLSTGSISRIKGNLEMITRVEEIEYDDKVYDLQTGTHYFIANNFITHNCSLYNLEEIFKGCEINSIYIETPKSFRTACTVATQALSHATNLQYGL